MTQSQQIISNPAAGIGAVACPLGNLPLAALSYRSRIVGLAVETEIAQTFSNPHDKVIEATYIFPLPENGAVTKCQMKIGDRIVEARLRERQQAREEYQEALESGHRAALLEEDRSETFSLQVGNLAPDDIVEVSLVMITPLDVVAGEATLRLPLVVAPKYVPGVALDGSSVGKGTAVDTDQAPDASRVTPLVLLEGMPNPVRLSIQVDLDRELIAGDTQNACWFEQLDSPLFPISISNFDACSIKLDPLQRANSDFLLRFPVISDEVRSAAHVQTIEADGKSSEATNSSVLALTIVPPNESSETKQARDISFVLDRSGSMGGWKMEAATRAAVRLIESLGPDDRFQVIAFDSEVERPSSLPDSWITATDENRWQAVRWLATIDARGGTEMGPALIAALRQFEERVEGKSETQANRSKSIVLVTDGHIAGEDSVLATVAKFARQSCPRMFVVGIDRCVNMGIMKKLANATGGVAELVESKERFEQVFERLASEIDNPWLSDLKLELQTSGGKFELDENVFPVNSDALFHGRPRTVYAQCDAAPCDGTNDESARIRVTGKLASGESWESSVPVASIADGPVVSMWGRHAVRSLEDQYVMSGSSDHALQQKIIATSLQAGVLCRFTAFIAVDSSEVVAGHEDREEIVQPVESPAGWVNQHSSSGKRSAKKNRIFAKRKSLRSVVSPLAMPLDSDSDGLTGKKFCMSSFYSADESPGNMEGESADSILQEFTDTAIDFTEDLAEATDTAMDYVESVSFSDGDQVLRESLGGTQRGSRGASPAVQLLIDLIEKSVQLKASHILLVPNGKVITVYFLIDRELIQQNELVRKSLHAIVDQLKLRAKIDITVDDAEQSGQVEVSVARTDYVFDILMVPHNDRQAVSLRNNAFAESTPVEITGIESDEVRPLLNQFAELENAASTAPASSGQIE